MPIYEYACSKCGHQFEVMQKMADEPVKKCPECGKRVERLISHSSFVLKGTGWYQTDYARKNGSAATGNGKSNGEGKSAAKEGPGESKEKPAACPNKSAACGGCGGSEKTA